MKFALIENVHKKYIDDVVNEISQDELWRERLFAAAYQEKFLITYKELEELPCRLWNDFSKYGLEFLVSKVENCSEGLDKESVILKFEAKEVPDLIKYSGAIDCDI